MTLMKLILTALILTSLNWALAQGPQNAAPTFACTLEVFIDDGVDLAPDVVLPMKDSEGKPLADRHIEGYRLELTSKMIEASATFAHYALAGGAVEPGLELSVGLRTSNKDLVSAVKTKTFPNVGDKHSVMLDLRNAPSVRDQLGEIYDECDGDHGSSCHGNAVVLECIRNN